MGGVDRDRERLGDRDGEREKGAKERKGGHDIRERRRESESGAGLGNFSSSRLRVIMETHSMCPFTNISTLLT